MHEYKNTEGVKPSVFLYSFIFIGNSFLYVASKIF